MAKEKNTNVLSQETRFVSKNGLSVNASRINFKEEWEFQRECYSREIMQIKYRRKSFGTAIDDLFAM